MSGSSSPGTLPIHIDDGGAPAKSPLAYELRIGVTGHRALADDTTAQQTVRSLLVSIARALNRPAAPLAWTVVSPLARGADRVVADAVLELPGSRLEVVTPFPLAEYRTDFETSEDHAAFDELLGRAGRVHELDGIPRSGDRSRAYLCVGERVVDSSELLIAVWDGQPARGVGGTAEIVRYALERERLVIWIDSTRPEKPPRVVRAIRLVEGQASIDTTPLPQDAKSLSIGYAQQAAYSEDASVSANALASTIARKTAQLKQAAENAGIPAGALDAMLALVLPQYVRSDALALEYRHKHVRAVTGVLYLAAFAVTVAVMQVLFFPEDKWVIIFEVAAMVAVFALWAMGRRGCWNEKWLHDRYLAERLRSVTFSALIKKPIPEAATGDPLPFYRGPQQWLVHLVAALESAAISAAPALPFDQLKQFLIRAWLEDQQRFHTRSAHQHEHRARERHRLGFVLFGVTLVLALLHMFGSGHWIEVPGPRISQPALWITFGALVLPVWAGAIHGTTAQLELERIAERSRRMARVLDSLVHRAVRADNPGALAEIVREAVHLVTMETHEWWVLLSFQDVRLHV